MEEEGTPTKQNDDNNDIMPKPKKTHSGLSRTKSSINDINQTVLFKCYLEDDTRIIELSGKPTYEDLKTCIDKRFNRPVKITFVDEEHDVVTLDSSESMYVAITIFKSQPYIKLQLIPDDNISIEKQILDDLEEKNRHPSPKADSPLNSPMKENLKRSRDGSYLVGGARAQLKENSFEVSEINRVQMKEMLQSLEKTTHFDAQQLQEIVDFVKRECKDGIVHREAFTKAINAIGVLDPFTIEQYYSAFDVDKDGKIDIKEFAHGLSIVLKGSPLERLKLMFNAYDLDGDGTLDKNELSIMFSVALRSNGQEVKKDIIKRWVIEMLAKRNPNNKSDGVTFDEFSTAIQSKQLSFHDIILK